MEAMPPRSQECLAREELRVADQRAPAGIGQDPRELLEHISTLERVRAIPGRRATMDRNAAVAGHCDSEEDLLEVGPMVLAVTERDVRDRVRIVGVFGLVAPSVVTERPDRRGVEVEQRELELEGLHGFDRDRRVDERAASLALEERLGAFPIRSSLKRCTMSTPSRSLHPMRTSRSNELSVSWTR